MTTEERAESPPVCDGDRIALRGWCNRQGVIPPSGQGKLRTSVGRVLNALNAAEQRAATAEAEVERLQKQRDVAFMRGYGCGHRNGLEAGVYATEEE